MYGIEDVANVVTRDPVEVQILLKGSLPSVWEGDAEMVKLAQRFRGRLLRMEGIPQPYLEIQDLELEVAADSCRRALASLPRFRHRRERSAANSLLQRLDDEWHIFDKQVGWSS